MELVEFGPDEAAHFEAFLGVMRAADAVDSPWQPSRTAYRQAMHMRHSWEGEPGRWFVGYDAGTAVAVASLDSSRYDNLEMAWIELAVAPQHRRCGHGSAALRELEQVTVEMGRPLVLLDGWDSPGMHALATGGGYEQKSAEICRRLVVAEAPDPWPIHEESAALATDYDLVRIEGYTPSDLLPGVVEITAAINDAPIDDLEWQEEVYSPARVQAYERAQIETGQRFRRIVARHRTSGEIAGHTVMVVGSDQPTIAEQHDTSVARAHRGHRLGLLLKTEMQIWLAEAEPELERIFTGNAESNRHMIAINDRLGYRPVGRLLEFQRRLR